MSRKIGNKKVIKRIIGANKNKFDKSTIVKGKSIGSAGISNYSSCFITGFIEVMPGETLTWSGLPNQTNSPTLSGNTIRILFYPNDTDNTAFIQNSAYSSRDGWFSFTVPDNVNYIIMGTNSNFGTAANMQTFLDSAKMQLESGNAATVYTDYRKEKLVKKRILGSSKNKCPDTIPYFESGDYSATTGAKTAVAYRVRLKDLWEVPPSKNIYTDTFGFSDNVRFIFRTFDENKNFLRSISNVLNKAVTTLNANEKYLGISLADVSNTTLTFADWTNFFNTKQVKPFICLSTVQDKSYVPYRPEEIIYQKV